MYCGPIDIFLLGSHNESLIESWFDALNMLLNVKPVSSIDNITCLVECLYDTQMLDLQTLGIELTPNIPVIPKFPEDFDFKYMYKNLYLILLT